MSEVADVRRDGFDAFQVDLVEVGELVDHRMTETGLATSDRYVFVEEVGGQVVSALRAPDGQEEVGLVVSVDLLGLVVDGKLQ